MEGGKKALDEIKEAFENAKVWFPSIYCHSNHIDENSEGNFVVKKKIVDEKGTESYSPIDVVKLIRQLNDSADRMRRVLQDDMNYSPNTLFRFDNFKGLADKDNIKEFIYAVASEHGTS